VKLSDWLPSKEPFLPDTRAWQAAGLIGELVLVLVGVFVGALICNRWGWPVAVGVLLGGLSGLFVYGVTTFALFVHLWGRGERNFGGDGGEHPWR